MNAVELINKLPSAFNPQAASGTDCVIQFNVSTPMYAVIKDGVCEVAEGSANTSDIAITMDDADLVAMMRGELNGMTAFMTGKLQVDGDLVLAQKLASLFDKNKLV